MALLLPQARRLAAELKALYVCPGCLRAFSQQLQTSSPDAVDDLRAGCPEFWDACASIVASISLDTTVFSPLPGCTLHSVGDDTVRILVDAACACLHVCMHCAGGQPDAFGGGGLWPARLQDVLPDGARALVGWCVRLAAAPFPMLLLAELLSVAPEQVFPAVLREKDAMVDTLARSLSPSSLADIQTLGAAVAVLCSMRDATGSDVNALLMLTLGHEERLFAAAMYALELQPATSPSPLATALATFAASLFPRLELAESALDPRVRACVEDPSKLSLAGILYRLFRSMALRRRVCTARDCDNVAPFVICSHCGITPYCSSACDNDDWEALGGGIPHKVVCPIIARTLAVAPLNLSREEFEHAVLSAYQWSPQESYCLTFFAMAHGNLPMELLLRVQYLHKEFSAALGMPVDEYEELARDPEMAAAMDVMNRQERWSSGL